jgi:hypothetical protein
MLDGDLVRVDLLRIKRLLFTSYPEGSSEQLDFLRASKLNEIGYLSRLVPEETAKFVYEEYNRIMKYELLDIAACLGIGFCLSLTLFWFHQHYPTILWFRLFGAPFGIGFYSSLKHVWHMIKEWRKIQPFKTEHKQLLQRINKLKNEIKDSL